MFELYTITDGAMLSARGIDEVEAARLCYEAGADVVQLRMKDADGAEMLAKAKEIEALADRYSKFFIVNDRVDVAILSGADGVHLGQSDIPVAEARSLCGEAMIIGVSVNTPEEAVEAVEGGADYLGVGSIFTTTTKPDAEQALGLDAIVRIREVVGEVPIVAIGGINRGNILDVFRHGADSAAVVSAVMDATDIQEAAHELKVMILNDRRTR